ncbi:hypothetical protein ACJX0J_005565, partial [Zea mays]
TKKALERNGVIGTNDIIGPYFNTHKGVRQGDPFSPLLFNIAADGVARLLKIYKKYIMLFSNVRSINKAYFGHWRVHHVLYFLFIFSRVHSGARFS